MKGPFKFPHRLPEDERDTLGQQISTFIEGETPWVIPYSILAPNLRGQMHELYACRECVRGRVIFKWEEKIFSTVTAQCDHCGQDYTITSVP